MDKAAIRNFAIWARNKLISDVAYRAGLLGITADGIADKLPQSTNSVQFYDIGTSEPYRITGKEITQRSNLALLIKRKTKSSDYATAYSSIIEEVAYTWFNRLIAIRFMEVNDYLPSHIRVLSSENGKIEPDIVTNPFDVDLGITDKETSKIIELKQNNESDELFKLLFIKQCNKLSEILPRLFEKTDDYTELLYNCSYVDQEGIVYRLTHDIPEEDFDVNRGGQVEIIGWLYQYYNAELKDDTFALLKKNVKITKERIPSATQLFTPDWIVRYMVENSLGRLWTEGHVNTSSQLCSNWKYYLEEAEQDPDVQARLEGIRQEYSMLRPENIKLIDPCMGSGHILVYAFDVLIQIYESEGYSQRDAAVQILKKNIFGLDIDDRAAQLSYFAVMMKARQYNRRILDGTHDCNVLAIQESNGVSTLQTYMAPFGDLSDAALRLINDFNDAKEYGSILNISLTLDEIDALETKLDGIRNHRSDDVEELMVEAYILEHFPALLAQARIMVQKYDVVVTNPPYMGGSNMNDLLSDYVNRFYPASKSDMSTICMEKTLSMCEENGYMGMINIPVWMTLSSYVNLREKLIKENRFVNMLHLGRGVFGSDFGTTAFIFSKGNVNEYKGKYFRLFNEQGSVDSVEQKEKWFSEKKGEYTCKQENYINLPGCPISYWISEKLIDAYKQAPMSNYADLRQGLITGDNNLFLRSWFECSLNEIGHRWFVHYKGGDFRRWYGNNQLVVDWENDGARIRNYKDDKGKLRSRPQNVSFYFKEGFTWSALTASKLSVRYMDDGGIFAAKGSSGFTKHREDLWYLIAFCNTKVCMELISILSQSLDYNAGTMAQVPVIFNMDYKDDITNFALGCIDISKEDWDSNETSLGFKKHPLI